VLIRVILRAGPSRRHAELATERLSDDEFAAEWREYFAG
jgi:hypothetical protein